MGGLQSLPEREAIRSLHSIVRAHPLDKPVLSDVLAPLSEALRLEYAATHRLAPTIEGGGWDAVHLATHPRSFEHTVRTKYLPFVKRSMVGTGTYSPLRPQRDQRNRVVMLGQIKITNSIAEQLLGDVFPSLGVGGMDQIRVLLCDGPRLQAWIGGFRPDAFGERERRVLRGLVPTLVERLRLEEALDTTDMMRHGLEVALGLVGAPAFLVDHRARVVVASDPGARLLESDARGTRERLLAALARRSQDTVLPVTRPGASSWHLVVLRAPGAAMDERLARATRMWNLTPRQGEVLALVAHGDANKTIADKLDCAPGTVELHVSAILAKANAESRAALVAMFWR